MGPPPLATAATSREPPTGPHHLARAALAAQLDARLVDQPEPVQAAARELAAGRVEGQEPVAGDVGARPR